MSHIAALIRLSIFSNTFVNALKTERQFIAYKLGVVSRIDNPAFRQIRPKWIQ